MLVLPKQNEYEQAPIGVHTATCYQVIDLGSQIKEFNGEKKVNREIRVTWELPEALMADGKPFSISKFYTYSSHEKSNLLKDLNAWRGKPFTKEDFGTFDLTKLLGKSCNIQISHTEKGKAKVSTVMALKAGEKAPALVNKPLWLSLDKFDQTVFDSLSEFLRTTIAASPEYRELKGMKHEAYEQVEVEHYPDESIPF